MQPRQSGHPYIDIIQTYYQGCNTADFDLMMSTFTEDVVHYFVDHSAVSEIRSYHNNFHLQGPENRHLQGFDYAGRGYRTE